MKRRSSVGGGRARPLNRPPTLCTAATNLVTLITETSPTPPGAVAPLAFTLRADGGAAPFTLRKGTVLVPQFETLASNPSDMSVLVHGYLARHK